MFLWFRFSFLSLILLPSLYLSVFRFPLPSHLLLFSISFLISIALSLFLSSLSLDSFLSFLCLPPVSASLHGCLFLSDLPL